ncbi:efflux RND transporter periplasmic adaptor subunit [uncultured Phenylobacterium sp.]|uniref:efflux RND transporter periplasmic adaptor subunit n=1 Tax=uncultured Phenylobacterium sp. TaxID=349273 RepID=UPI0025D94E0B|nr:efflux RND transporter periplasmic adaptor subunit [uncultured Phenylobacterium sp.]
MKLAKLLIPLAAVLALSACKKPPEKQTEAERARAVSVVRVELRPITGALSASGDLIPREEAAVVPEVNGYRVARVLADVGQYVKAGQTLVQLDNTLLQAQVAQAQALAAQAEAQAQQAEDQARRVKDLDGTGVLSQEQIDQRRFQATAARAQARAQAASLKDLQTRAGKLSVAAPVSGLILEKNVRPGDLSAPGGAAPWFRIARDGQIELAAEMSEADLAHIRVGQSATVTLPGGVSAQGRVRLISPQIDPQTKLGDVRVLLPVRSDIRAGGFGRALFADASAMALVIPEAAVRYDADGASVMTVQSNNRVRRVLVQTGQRGGGLVQLTRGPPAGTRVIRNAGAFLLDNDMVRPVEGAAPAVVGPAAPRPAT